MANSGWTSTTLGELIDAGEAMVQTGPFGSQLHSYDYRTAGVPVVPTEAIGRRRLNNEAVPQIDETKASSLARHRLQPGDILFARRGVQATGLSAIVEPRHDGWLCGTGAILLRVLGNAVDPAYLSFYLSDSTTIAWLRGHAVGAVMPNLNETVLRLLPIIYPSVSEQRRIAASLGAFDDKIELNRRMNETLEAMTRALFKSWFIDFDPVHAKAAGRKFSKLDSATAKLFPDRFENSALGPIPTGWRVGTIGDIAKIRRDGVQPDQIDPNTPYIGLEHMPRRCIALSEWGYAESLESNKSAFTRGDILFGKLRPYFHKVGVAPVDGVCSTDILVIQPKEPLWFGFALMNVSSDEMISHTDQASTGTKMPRTNWQDLARFQVVIPPTTVAEKFTAVLTPMIGAIYAGIYETRNLAIIRDALLPNLLSGKWEAH